MVLMNLDSAVLVSIPPVLQVRVWIDFFPLALLNHLRSVEYQALLLGLPCSFLQSFFLEPASVLWRLLEEVWWVL
jgi:hypothetical protein